MNAMFVFSRSLTMIKRATVHQQTIRSLATRRARLGIAKKTFHKGYRVPSQDDAVLLPRTRQEMDNNSLATLAALGDHEANSEMVKRHIMSQDNVSYAAAEAIFAKIEKRNSEGKWLLAFPYHFGIAVATTTGVLSVPMVFDLGTAKWFNTGYVTMDLPDPEDLETILETGSWTWNWMEPPLGTISFLLLALQFSRAQMQNLGIKPYTEFVKHRRGKQLAEAFPQYDANILAQYSESTSIQN